jgi:glycosyltransferase involved in cell wall biosynthesis
LNKNDIAYVLLRFPRLTETFVAEEIRNVQKLGINVRIFSLLSPSKRIVHAVSAELSKQVCCVPSITDPSLWYSQIYFIFKNPQKYFHLLWILLSQPAPKISFLPKRLIIFLKSIWLALNIKDKPVKLVHTHFAWLSAAAGMIVSELLDIPFTITTHAYDIYSYKNDLLELTTKMADRIVTISEYNKNAMLKMSNGLDDSKIDVIHCGIDLAYFKPTKKEDPNNVIQITSIGSLIEKKGHEYLIRACKSLESEGIEFNCVIIGEGELRNHLQELIDNLRLRNKIALIGAKTQGFVKNRLNETDLFVLACRVAEIGDQDGIPVAIMEALAMEVPVISTRVSGIPELIKDGETGILVPERDPKALAKAIVYIVQERSLSQELAINGRILVEREFNISKNVYRLSQLFQQVIEERGQ